MRIVWSVLIPKCPTKGPAIIVLLRLDRKALGTPRVGELTVFGLSSYISCSLMYYISPQLLTVISGILSALAGIVWFVREKKSDGPRQSSSPIDQIEESKA